MNRSLVVVIIRAELLAWRNRIVRANSARVVGLVIFGLVAALVLGGSLFAASFAAGRALPSARDSILSGAFTALAVMMLVVGFPSVIASYFAGRDLMQLIIAPVRTFDIFLARSVFALSANVLVALVFVTFVVGLGAGSGASPLYYGLALILVIVQVLVVSAVQLNFMAAVLRLVPARIARDVAVALASVTGAGLYLAWNLTIRQTFASFQRQADLTSLVRTLRGLDWLPTSWPGHALSAVISGDAISALAWTALTFLLAAALLAVAAKLYESTLLAGLGLLGGVRSPTRARRSAPVPASRGRSSPGWAIARKDWIVYRRDIRRLSRFLPALLFLLAYAFLLIRPSRGGDVFWSAVFAVTFVSFFMSMLFATTAIPSERRGFHMLRLAPITTWQVIRAKVLFTVVPVMALTTLIAIALSVLGGNKLGQALQLIVLGAWLALGSVCIGVSAGAIDPQFESADDRRAVGLIGTFAALGGELGFGLTSIGAFALVQLAQRLAGGEAFGPIAATPEMAALAAVGSIVPAALAAGVIGLLLWSANVRLGRFEGAISAA